MAGHTNLLGLGMRCALMDWTGEYAGCGMPREASLTEVLEMIG
jgi:hypothetical protein